MSKAGFTTFTTRFHQIPWRAITSDVAKRAALIIKTACVVHLVNNHVVSIAFVRGPSMIPAFNLSGDVVLIDRVTPWWGKIEVGDVVFVRSPEDPLKIVMKRVTGLEGDSVSFLDNPVLGTKIQNVKVPKGHIFVQGDNIYDSRDSRQFGSIPYGLMHGKAILKVWPPREFGLVQPKAV